MNFKEFKLNEKLLNAIYDLNYSKTTKIQELAIPKILNNKDLIAVSQTGTGKTASFSLPILQKIIEDNKNINNKNNTEIESKITELKCIILAPTRELVFQIYNNIKEFSKYLDLNIVFSHGGYEIEEQLEELKKNNQIIISTPKRLYDLREKKLISFKDIKYLIIDEVDKIVQEDSNNNLKKIFKILPKDRQTLLFSATLNSEIEEIIKNQLKEDYEKIIVKEEKVNIDLIEQFVFFVKKENKFKLLLDILKEKEIKQSLIFLNDKQDIDNLVRFLRNNNIKSAAFHSAKSNVHREKVLNQFKNKELKILIATDIASRGLDIENISHIINFDIPLKAKDYIHRIGRSGRANIKGTAYSFCSNTEKSALERIEKEIKHKLKIKNHKYHSHFAQTATGEKAKPKFNSKKNIKKKEDKTIKIKGSKIDFSKWTNKK